VIQIPTSLFSRSNSSIQVFGSLTAQTLIANCGIFHRSQK